MRANDEILIPSKNEGINFIAYEQPVKLVEENGKFIGVQLERNLPSSNDPNNLKYKPTGEKSLMKFDYLITAFGSEIGNSELN